MHKSLIGVAGAALASLILAATPAHAASKTIVVPDDFNVAASDTRATGHYEVQGTALHIWTEGSTSTDKVAEYVDTSVPLANTDEPSLSYDATFGIPPGFQLVVDFDGNGTHDGILVGEPTAPGYGNNWWASNNSSAAVKAGAPHTGGGFGSPHYGTLDEWRANFPNAVVQQFGFSLGSGVHGDGLLNSLTFAGDTYTFATPTRDQCKDRVKAEEKAFDDQQKADKKAFEATNPSKAAKKDFDENQKAAKKDAHEQRKTDQKACDDLPKH